MVLLHVYSAYRALEGKSDARKWLIFYSGYHIIITLPYNGEAARYDWALTSIPCLVEPGLVEFFTALRHLLHISNEMKIMMNKVESELGSSINIGRRSKQINNGSHILHCQFPLCCIHYIFGVLSLNHVILNSVIS